MLGREPCGVREDALAAEEDHQHEHDDLELQQARHRADERRRQLPVRRGQPLALQLINAEAHGAKHQREFVSLAIGRLMGAYERKWGIL